MIIGIVGKVGAGKTSAIEYIVKNYNAIYFSCDEIAKEILSKEKHNLNFSEQIFTNENFQEQIRQDFHPKVFKRIFENILELIKENQRKNSENKQIFLIETALPNEDFMDKCDKVIYIDNSLEKKVEILKEHRNYSESKINAILDSQKYYEKFYKNADYVIENNGTVKSFLDKVKEVMDEICVICK